MSSSSFHVLAQARIPVEAGEFDLKLYTGAPDGKEHLAFVYGDVADGEEIMVRVHSECFTGDVLGSQRCDCGEQLQRSIRLIAKEGRGAVLYLRQEGRGIGLAHKLRAYNLQDEGLDTVEANLRLGHQADERDYSVAAGMIRDLGIRSIRLLTNNPDKIERLRELGITVTDRVAISPQLVNDQNRKYFSTKITKMRHMFSIGGLDVSARAT